ncbi:MAG: YciI family protein [Pseudonocardia sp.]|nr:YciI family protein [Pseudonocardia sp.]
MKYMLMIYDNPDTRSVFFGPEGAGLMAEMEALMGELTESGELVSTDALADPSSSKVVRVRDDVPVITDGPLAEAKEHFGGYLIVDCESEARALDIAARWPSAKIAAMEVRPILDPAGEEM